MTPRQKSMIVGSILGAALGAMSGYLFTRRFEQAEGRAETQALSLRSVPPGDAAKLIIAIIGVLRGIAELGDRL
jgi:hypothetical protein